MRSLDCGGGRTDGPTPSGPTPNPSLYGGEYDVLGIEIDYDYFLGSCVVCFVGTRHAVSVCFDVMTRFSRTRRAVSLLS